MFEYCDFPARFFVLDMEVLEAVCDFFWEIDESQVSILIFATKSQSQHTSCSLNTDFKNTARIYPSTESRSIASHTLLGAKAGLDRRFRDPFIPIHARHSSNPPHS